MYDSSVLMYQLFICKVTKANNKCSGVKKSHHFFWNAVKNILIFHQWCVRVSVDQSGRHTHSLSSSWLISGSGFVSSSLSERSLLVSPARCGSCSGEASASFSELGISAGEDSTPSAPDSERTEGFKLTRLTPKHQINKHNVILIPIWLYYYCIEQTEMLLAPSPNWRSSK